MPTDWSNTARRSAERILSELQEHYDVAELLDGLGRKFGDGWFPRDLAQLPGLDRSKRTLLVDLIAAHRRTWHEAASTIWFEHADYLGASVPWWDGSVEFWPQFLERHAIDAVDAVVAARLWLGIFATEHKLHEFAPPPWQPGGASSNDQNHQKVMGKIQGLLAKAESTEYPDEAESLTAKAQELISRHSIDIALLANEVDVPGGSRVYLEAPYTKPKFLLLSGIAEANRCQAVFSSRTNTATLIGFATDITLTEVLFTSLLVQGTAAVLAAGPQSGWDGTSSTKSWRNSFWFGYADRIQDRLVEAAGATQATAAAGNTQLLPVLARRSEAVQNALEAHFPNLSAMQVSVSNAPGLAAGRSFAEQADLGHSRVSSPRKRLGR